MADSNAIAENCRAGWSGFCRFLLLSTTAVVISLGLMAIFLL